MPDELGLLSQQEKENCVDWLRKKSEGILVCPICKTTNWGIADHLLKANVLTKSPAAITIGTPVYAYFQLCCNTCGYAMLINAVDAGLVTDLPTSKSEVGK